MSITSFFRPLIVALLLFEGGLQAQPLVETYRRQEELRLRVADICSSQFEKAQYHPVEGSVEDVRYMISAKGVQAIKAVVIPARPGGSYKCDRGSYEQPMLLGRTYTSRNLRVITSKQAAACRSLERQLAALDAKIATLEQQMEGDGTSAGVAPPPPGSVDLSRCANVKKERFELEPCIVRIIGGQRITTSCLISYTQLDDDLVEQRTLAFRRRPQSE